MSLSTGSATNASYVASSGNGSGVARAIEEIPARIADAAEGAADVVGDVASATVSFSARALQALEDGGGALLNGIEDVVSFPFEMAKDAAVGAGHLVEEGWDALTDGVSAVASGIGSAVHAVVVDLPAAVISDVASVAKAAVDNADSVAGAAAGVAALTGGAPLKALSTLV
jgi:hypothetical protein